jgi:CHAD domain-containing protein
MLALAHPSDHAPPASTPNSRRLIAPLLKRRIDGLFRHLPAALSGDEEAVHQLRVAGRRLRVAVSLLSEKPDGRRAGRCQRLLRDLTRVAGKSRDLDVLLATYDERLGALSTRDPGQGRLRHRLGDARRRGRGRMVGELLDVDIAHLRRDLAVLLGRGGPSLHEVALRYAELCKREGSCLREGFAALGSLLDPVRLHALRRRARRLRYAVELADALFHLDGGSTKPWKALQERIGVLHDHEMLAEWFERQAQADERRGQGDMAALAASEAAWARATMQRLHDELLAHHPSQLVDQGLAFCALPTTPTGPG